MNPPSLSEIRLAASRISPHARRTPVFTSTSLDNAANARLFLKCENLQRVGAFKFRGACNAVLALPDHLAPAGVAAHSSGNHAQALALAARIRGIPAYIVMPDNAPPIKKSAVQAFGGQITLCPPTLRDREESVARLLAQTGATEIHPYNNPLIIAGQATATLELLEDFPDLDAIITPVGGGGLLSGSAIAAKSLNPAIRVLAAEPAGADDAARSLASGHIQPSLNPKTICDGLLTSLGSLTFPIIQQHVQRIITVPDDQTIAAMRLAWERAKTLIEPSSAVALAALFQRHPDLAGLRIGVILSGGNADLTRLPWQPA